MPENKQLHNEKDKNKHHPKDEAWWKEFVETYKYKEKSEYARLLWPRIARKLNMDINLIDDPETKAIVQTSQPRIRLWRKINMLKVAAVLIPLLMVGITLTLLIFKEDQVIGGTSTDPVTKVITDHEKPDNTEIVVKEDGTYRLPDQSVIRLGKESEMHYAKHFEDNRQVELAGEAHFNVTKAIDKDHTFVVHTDHMKITVLGTEFDVKCPVGESVGIIDLYHGSIHVETTYQSLIMTSGDHLEYDYKTENIKISRIPIGMRIYDSMEKLSEGGHLHQILQIVEEEYNIPVMIAGTLPELHIRADLSGARTAHELMHILKTLTGVFAYEITDHEIRIKPNE